MLVVYRVGGGVPPGVALVLGVVRARRTRMLEQRLRPEESADLIVAKHLLAMIGECLSSLFLAITSAQTGLVLRQTVVFPAQAPLVDQPARAATRAPTAR